MNANSTLIDRILEKRWVAHSLFWVTFSAILAIYGTLNDGEWFMHFINGLALLPAQLLAAYTLSYYQVPKLLLKKKYGLFFLSFVISIYLFGAMARIGIVYFAEPFFRTDFEQESVFQILADAGYLFLVYFPAVYIFAFLFFIIKSIKQRFEETHQMEVLKKEKINAELQFLKAQIHPHFLFNTLNNLYALTLAKSDAAPEVVLKLSEMLDFMLYQCNAPSIPICKEIELIESYIDLEKLRYGKNLDLIFNHHFDDKNAPIAPLILLSLIENAFKHGVSSNPFNPKIHIDLKVEKDQLSFMVFNTKNNVSSTKKVTKNGIGTTNVQRQLVLNYPEKHQLNIEETEEDYTVNLTLHLVKRI